MAEKTVFQSQLEDKEAFAFVKSHKAVESAMEAIGAGVPDGRSTSGMSALEAAANTIENTHLKSAFESLRTGETELHSPDTAEAIIMLTGYPSMLVQNGDFDASPYGAWQDRLDPYRDNIKSIIAGVGRVELKNHPSGMPWIGTCWLVGDDLLITNRHVARFFSQLRQGAWEIMPGVEVNVDFAEELGSKEALEYLISSIMYIEDNENIDLALMKLAPRSAVRLGLSPVPLDTRLAQVEYIGTIGYPADDMRNNPRDAFTKYFQGQFGVKRFAPGRIMNANYNPEQFTHNCTTLGGNSGSVVFNVASGGAVGLHFGGNAQVQNYAVNAATIATVFGKQNIRPQPLRGEAGAGGVGKERRGSAEDFGDRNGYNPGFLGEGSLDVPMPILGRIWSIWSRARRPARRSSNIATSSRPQQDATACHLHRREYRRDERS